MGTVRDWNKVFDGIDYLEFECIMSFLPDVGLEEKESVGQTYEVKEKELFENGKWVYEAERGFGHLAEKRNALEKEMTESIYKVADSAEIFERIFEKAVLGESLFEEKFASGEIEAVQRTEAVFRDERDVYGREEKISLDVGAQKEKTKVLNEAQRREVIKSVNEIRDEKERVQIETRSREERENEVDMDRITDMLTLRLCDMMQRSAEGYYI